MISIFYNSKSYTLRPISCVLNKQLNGVWQVTMEYSTADERFKYIVENAVLQVPTPHSPEQLYRIYNVQKSFDTVIAYALPIFIDSGREVVLIDSRPTDKTGQQALDIMMQGTKYHGHSDILDVNTSYYIRKNLMEAIAGDDDNAFLNRWGGEVLYDNYDIYINKNIGADRGMRVEFGYNMLGITEDISTANTVTRIIPLAYNGRMLEGSQPWVDSPLIRKYPIVYTKVIEYPDIRLAEDNNGEGYTTIEGLRAALRQAAAKEFETGIDLPSINYDVEMVDLAGTVEYASIKELVKVSLGDIVTCKNTRLDIETKAKVIGITYDCILERITAVQLGDYRTNYFDKVSSSVGKTAATVSTNGEVKGETISGIIDLMAAKLRAAHNAATPQADKAILFEDNDENSNTYGAMAIGTTGFEIARGKDHNGEWVWSTFGTGQGFYADCIIAGVLFSQNFIEGKQGFKFDLNTGDIYATRLDYHGQELGAYVQTLIDESVQEGQVYITDQTPTLHNYPANLWHAPIYPADNLIAPQVWQYSEEYYIPHKGDMAFDAVNGLLYIFKKNDEGFYWELQPASPTQYILKSLTALTVEEGKISTSVSQLSADLQNNYWSISETMSAIDQTSRMIQMSVEANYATLYDQERLAAELRITAEQVQSKVSRGDVSSTISQEAEIVDIRSNRFTWESTNSSMDLNGKLKTQNIEITGGSIKLVSDETSANMLVTSESGYTKIYGNGAAFSTHDQQQSISMVGGIVYTNNGQNNTYIGDGEVNVSGRVSGNTVYSSGDTTVMGDLWVFGEKLRVIPANDYGAIGMNAVESLGAFFSDFGSATITDGSVAVAFDDRLSVTCGKEYYIMVTVLEGYIDRIEKHTGYFVAYGEGKFDFAIYAKQKGYEDVYGNTNYTAQKQFVPIPGDVLYGESIEANALASYDALLAEMEDNYEEIFNQLRNY